MELFGLLTKESEESEFFRRARQYGDTLVFFMDHSKVTQMSVWQVLEYGASFGSEDIDIVNHLEQDFSFNGSTFMVMFNCFELRRRRNASMELEDIYTSDDVMSIPGS